MKRICPCLVLGWALGLASCAAASPPPPVTPTAGAPSDTAPLPSLPRSSIAAVVQHRAELGLSDDQVRELEMRDLEREKEDSAVRDEVEQRRKQAQAPKASPPSGGTPAGAPGGGMGMRGGGMRGGGMRGGGMGGHGPQGPGVAAHEPRPEPSIEDRLDANDTKAYLDAEAFLNDGQREKARETASDFREKLYDRRVLLGAHAAAPK